MPVLINPTYICTCVMCSAGLLCHGWSGRAGANLAAGSQAGTWVAKRAASARSGDDADAAAQGGTSSCCEVHTRGTAWLHAWEPPRVARSPELHVKTGGDTPSLRHLRARMHGPHGP